ncbi:MAG: MBL fold metallo-hydrolase [Coriobacteriia bacterium]|nr:MBL fold metallo-hydrolase [Coriobacteriia bacterium]
MDVVRVPVGVLETNCWIIECPDGGVVVIDPGDDTDTINEAIAERPVHAVILTHGHFDHVGAADEVADDNSSFVWAYETEVTALEGELGRGGELFGVEITKPKIDRTVIDGDVIETGGLRFEVLHTPGHTPGSMCLLVADPQTGEQHLFSGDMLFAGSVGRTDLPGSIPEEMEPSLERLAANLPSTTQVYPGHGPVTTIEREQQVNPFWPR